MHFSGAAAKASFSLRANLSARHSFSAPATFLRTAIPFARRNFFYAPQLLLRVATQDGIESAPPTTHSLFRATTFLREAAILRAATFLCAATFMRAATFLRAATLLPGVQIQWGVS